MCQYFHSAVFGSNVWQQRYFFPSNLSSPVCSHMVMSGKRSGLWCNCQLSHLAHDATDPSATQANLVRKATDTDWTWFCDLQTLIFNKADHKSAEKLQWANFSLPFLPTGTMILLCLGAPLLQTSSAQVHDTRPSYSTCTKHPKLRRGESSETNNCLSSFKSSQSNLTPSHYPTYSECEWVSEHACTHMSVLTTFWGLHIIIIIYGCIINTLTGMIQKEPKGW